MPWQHQTAYERHAPDPREVSPALAGSRSGVFWLEEAGAGVRHPALRGSADADLTIVGGGYLGLWTAVLAKRRNPGQRVVLLEGRTIGWAASGRNGGFVEASITHGEENGRARWPAEYATLERLGQANLDAFQDDVAALQLDCHWERTGALQVAVEQHQLAWLDDDPDALDAEAVRREVRSPLFLGGTIDEHGTALVQPARLALELARVATGLGVEVYEQSPVAAVRTPRGGRSTVSTPSGSVTSDRVVLATNVFRSLLRRNRLMTVPVYDYVLMTEPLASEQLAAVGWRNRRGLADMANQFHYARLTQDNRILYGGYDAIYHPGRLVRTSYEDRPESFGTLASHFLATFPQLTGIRFTHRWGGAIDTCTRFTAFYGLARQGRVAYAAGFTGLGVGATRFAAEVLLDLLSGQSTERTSLQLVKERPLPFPPEPAAALGINAARWALDRADHRQGRRNLLLRALDAAGLGFDS
jgi:glycine/D-amino acid oxidase-like deaminating enzyme